MLVGYARISTADQNLSLQMDALAQAGCCKIFTDQMTGSAANRPGLSAALEFVRKGDSLVVWKLDRLGRSLKNLIELVTLLDNRGVELKSLQEGIDTSTPGGKLVFHVFGAVAEFERDLIRERTQAGLAAARARGRLSGRPRSVNKQKIKLALELAERGDRSIGEICDVVGISRSSYYRLTNSIASKE